MLFCVGIVPVSVVILSELRPVSLDGVLLDCRFERFKVGNMVVRAWCNLNKLESRELK